MEFRTSTGKVIGSFEEVRDIFASQACWVRFNTCPGCGAAGVNEVHKNLEELTEQINACDELTDAQREELLKLAVEGSDWFEKTPLCQKSRFRD